MARRNKEKLEAAIAEAEKKITELRNGQRANLAFIIADFMKNNAGIKKWKLSLSIECWNGMPECHVNSDDCEKIDDATIEMIEESLSTYEMLYTDLDDGALAVLSNDNINMTFTN